MIEKLIKKIKKIIAEEKARKLKKILNILKENKFDIIYVGQEQYRNKQFDRIMKKIPYLDKDQIIKDLFLNSYNNIFSILYTYHTEKSLLRNDINKERFVKISSYLMKVPNKDYAKILLDTFIKYVGIDNTFDPFIDEYSQKKFREHEYTSQEKDESIKYFYLSLVVDKDISLSIIKNPLIVSDVWNSSRIYNENAVRTYNSIIKNGFTQDDNHHGSYISNIHTLFINHGNHSCAIGTLLNYDREFTLNKNIKAYKFNHKFFDAEFQYNKVIIDKIEYVNLDWRKNAIFRIAQELYKRE